MKDGDHQYADITFNFLSVVKPKSFRDEAKIEMETRTIALFASPKVPNAEDLRSSIDERDCTQALFPLQQPCSVRGLWLQIVRL